MRGSPRHERNSGFDELAVAGAEPCRCWRLSPVFGFGELLDGAVEGVESTMVQVAVVDDHPGVQRHWVGEGHDHGAG
jgi:hypothetical protein